jgi:hypothetical protein
MGLPAHNDFYVGHGGVITAPPDKPFVASASRCCPAHRDAHSIPVRQRIASLAKAYSPASADLETKPAISGLSAIVSFSMEVTHESPNLL